MRHKNWDPITLSKGMYVVIDCEEPYECTPIAILGSEQEANEWIDMAKKEQQEKGDDSRYTNTEHYVALAIKQEPSVVSDPQILMWNDISPVPKDEV